jgi:hypothetical protein
MSRTTRVLAALFAAFALSAAGLVMASAQATTAPTTISGHVRTTGDLPVRGVIVYAIKGSTVVQFHATDENGDFGTPSAGHLTGGVWTFVFWDTTDKYASTAQENVSLANGANPALPVETLDLGGRVVGKVTARSGAELVNVPVMAIDQAAEEESDALWNFGVGLAFDDTDTDGTFDLRSLDVSGSQSLVLNFDEESTFRDAGSFSIDSEGDGLDGSKVVNVTGVRIPVATSVHGSTSSSKGKASVRLTVSGKKYGIADPHGTFDIYDGSKRIKAGYGLTRGTRTIALSHLKKGTHTFYFSYHGGQDTTSKHSSKFKVKVK